MGGQYHHELIYCPPSYVLCVSSHSWPFTIVKFVLEKVDKNSGSAAPMSDIVFSDTHDISFDAILS